jgi:hypothetical protein
MELIFALFFLFIFFEISISCSNKIEVDSEVMRVELEDVRLRKGYKILWMHEKTKTNNKKLFIWPKNFILFLIGCFLRMPKRNFEWRIMNYECGCSENGKHLQKTMQTLT